ncbi:MAG TPA: 3-deoxy-manno-octulosonate cytidylyltransferase [Bacteroidia bacterium]|jgi:3-deoxy-manno-octulosonate cytidylyltransferase (CMP-KDO synthetase)
MEIIGIIPARYASTRFPGKPLTDIGGISMIERVYRQSKSSSLLADVVVATDDDRIFSHVTGFGGKVVMTSDRHQSGTDRCFEAIQKFRPSADVVVNIQGDEPFIQPGQIDLVASCFAEEHVGIATLVKKVSTDEELFNHNIPKVLLDKEMNAVCFSRQTIPHVRGKQQSDWLSSFIFYKHIGIYAYRTKVLAEITALDQSPLELAEALEQMRWIENGYRLKVKITDFESVAVDVPDDLRKLTSFL